MLKKAFVLIGIVLLVCICFIGCEKNNNETHYYIDYEIIDSINDSNSEIEVLEIMLELVDTKDELIEVATIRDYRKYPDKTATYRLHIADKYDDDFFEEYSLILFQLYLPTPGSESHLDSIEIIENTIVVNSTYIHPKEDTLDVEVGWGILVIKVKKDDIKGITAIRENRTHKIKK